jgi:Domain of unknown function (DUF4189)
MRPLLLLLVTLHLGADCVSECAGTVCSDFGNHSDACVDLRAKCQTKCASQKSWGAIAYSAKDKVTGWSEGFADPGQAQQKAVDNCSARGGACKVFVWYNNSCGSLAVDGDIVTFGTADIRATADQRALLDCKNAGGKKCVVLVSQCSR